MPQAPTAKAEKLAVVLFNLGGPDCPEAVRPFLFNLFYDRAILRLPNPWRWMIAQLISRTRANTSRAIYRKIGGKSPLLAATRDQARLLKDTLRDSDVIADVFVCMRYWHPFTTEAVSKIKAFAPDKIVLLPLYPQFSSTTAGTSLAAFQTEAERQRLTAPIHAVCCYPDQSGFLKALSGYIESAISTIEPKGPPRILLSAHGLPERTIAAGDPYQVQVELTASAITKLLDRPNLDVRVCYQSRVGPVKWIGPSAEDEIRQAGRDGVPVVVAPIAFVSEHVETLVEIEMDLRNLAESCGVPTFSRVPTVSLHPDFIKGLAEIVHHSLSRPGVRSHAAERICPHRFPLCPAGNACR
jgi:ferrochelatase